MCTVISCDMTMTQTLISYIIEFFFLSACNKLLIIFLFFFLASGFHAVIWKNLIIFATIGLIDKSTRDVWVQIISVTILEKKKQ